MLDLWSVYLTLYRMMLCWTRDMCIWHYTEWLPCWTRDLCIWHYTEWIYVGLVICVSDIIQLDSWSVYLTFTEWCHVGLMICVSDIIQNGSMLDSWSMYLALYRMMRSRVQHGSILYNVRCTDHDSDMPSFCIMSDAQITSPTWHHSVNVRYISRVQHSIIL